MTLAFRYAVRTHVGLVRENNEDSGYAGPNLIMVADGMGGVAGGELASAITIDVVRQEDRPGHIDPLAALSAAATEANTRIARRGQAEPRYDGMGTTLTAGVLFDENKLALLHIGDSRGYLLRDGDLTQITHDHTFVQSLVDDGRLTEAQARVHPHRALIIRVLDGSQDHKPDLNTIELHPGDRLLLCSDGTEDVQTADITETLRDNPDPGVAAEALIRLALRSGTSDNVTCVIADVVEGAASTETLVMGAASEVDLSAVPPVETTADQAMIPVVEQPAAELPVAADLNGLADRTVDDDDDEELRYAPRPPRRFRWVIRSAFALVLIAALVAGGFWAYDWTQHQYYVGTAKQSDGEHVAIYRGVPQEVPGLTLSRVFEVSPVMLASLPTMERSQLTDPISANSLDDARKIIGNFKKTADECAKPAQPAPTPTPPPTKGPSASPSASKGPSRVSPTTGRTTPPQSSRLNLREPSTDCTGVPSRTPGSR